VGADDKIAVKLIKCGCWKVRFARSGLLFFTRKRYEKKRDKYEQHIARMLQFIGERCKQKQVQLRYSLEIKMSNPRLDRVERRDGGLQYNPMTIAELQKMTPAINWKDYFAGIF
jgi:endothelin-converting enzyme/putative endopeptidase